ncbi:Dyp-type peroxidase [Tunturiibacter gelidoferens]|uniref:Dyp-type peroxidase family n=2 Tax=Tunturiibacter TaxID=3154218 RepID=A0A7Y9T556_9BACT|nr:Dyp-type peroxidase [Edaphobacter lichenicola]MBB5338762.1 Dyp-type peroxidase family [Edaphobacter lichenicola]NYF51989.1 Dyp-type peroxidase family [Edaphobacter lichenicola]
MSKLNETDIQGFVLRGYNMPFARYLFLHFEDAGRAATFIHRLMREVTTGQRWDAGKPPSTVNVAFTHRGLSALELPDATLLSFPVEFQQGMKKRAAILGDTGRNSPDSWDELWRDDRVHAWLGVNASSPEALNARCADMLNVMRETNGAILLDAQDAASLVVNGVSTTKEHFGYTDGFGNPDYLGVERSSQPGQGKLTSNGTWAPLATGELLLGYADEAGELPVGPVPHILASNGTFMVYRKLHQNLATFRTYLDEHAALYAGGKEKLAAKFIGRWRDGTPIELSPDTQDQSITQDPARSTNFTFAADPAGTRCPMGAHVRRVNPRDAFGFDGKLINRRRITRRGLPYGTWTPEDQPVNDNEERGVIFIALNANISRQFEFVQQQWINYGNDARLGNEKDMLMGNHTGHGRFFVQGDTTPTNAPFVCSDLPNFVELRGGDYFFLPSITALGMIGMGLVDPR